MVLMASLQPNPFRTFIFKSMRSETTHISTAYEKELIVKESASYFFWIKFGTSRLNLTPIILIVYITM